MRTRVVHLFALTACLTVTGCVVEPTNQVNNNTAALPLPSATASPSPAVDQAASAQPLTLPVLDAFFADESFSGLLKSRLQLTDEQVSQLKNLAHSETAKLNEANAGSGERESAAARSLAAEKIGALIGAEKTRQLADLVGERWSAATDEGADKTTAPPSNPGNREPVAATAYSVPTDSRIVVNIPAYRMDVFDGGRLIKSYKIGIGYPQFPLPTGLRKARVIIFNPTWTPPDEPWVAKMRGISVGEKVAAGSKLNPLGPIKIPIGGPSLIHGGKARAKLGTFASHGCVGLTTPQIEDFAKLLAQLGGAHLTDAEVIDYERDKTQTKQLKLERPMPVELRYETIVVEDGKLHIYRDVYDEGTNTEENLRAVLEANGARLKDLNDGERTQVSDALTQMSGQSGGPSAGPKNRPLAAASPQSSSSPERRSNSGKNQKAVARNQKEIVIEIAALKGKGYPAPASLDTGSGRTRSALSALTNREKQP
ncbi:MAG TPA: L,D-transpeptidase [Pyrinomonadaceae bacterium]|nr:L,D-transpeptidase [Pyrinomonadaceae bacterium]